MAIQQPDQYTTSDAPKPTEEYVNLYARDPLGPAAEREYPRERPRQYMTNERELKPSDHFEESLGKDAKYTHYDQKYVHETKDHFNPTWNGSDRPTSSGYGRLDGGTARRLNGTPHGMDNTTPFTGSTTHVLHAEADEEARDILTNGLEVHTIEKYKALGYTSPPLSPLVPFTRIDPKVARRANLLTYNRFKIPMADLEYRKGFHNIFFSRPECYLMCIDGGKCKLCRQAERSQLIKSVYRRQPHLVELASPCYVSGAFNPPGSVVGNSTFQHNWNYLLSNRVISMDLGAEMTIDNGAENFTQSVNGYSISIGKASTSSKGGELHVTFRETKNLEVFEFLRVWMWYITSRYRGSFAPSYNGYSYENTFACPGKYDIHYHGYSRALDYCASLFDMFTDETGTKILHWSKWYGIYPIAASISGMEYDGQANVSELKVSATFYYQAKFQNTMQGLVEFNYNSGLLDDAGNAKVKTLNASQPFMYKEDGWGDVDTPHVRDQYIGAAGMFTGAPYVTMAQDGTNPRPQSDAGDTFTPYLQFLPLTQEEYDKGLNLKLSEATKSVGQIVSAL